MMYPSTRKSAVNFASNLKGVRIRSPHPDGLRIQIILFLADVSHAPLNCPLILHRYVIFNLLYKLVKFRDDSFIGCQEIRKNAVHWLKLKLTVAGGGILYTHSR